MSGKKMKKYSIEIREYESLLNRQFHVDSPNSKWVTVISYIHTK